MIFKRIRDLREDNDHTQVQLANYLYVNRNTYSRYENVNINIPIEALIKLADFYNTSVDYLMGRTDEKRPYPKSKEIKL